MSKLVQLDRKYWPEGGYGHWCPGCNSGHEINVDSPNSSGAKWTFNGNRYKPTFNPSINLRWGNMVTDPEWAGKGDIGGVCHYFIRDGMIQYLGDCTHSLAGKTVELPEIPDGNYLTSNRL